jgi:hypothetical protein
LRLIAGIGPEVENAVYLCASKENTVTTVETIERTIEQLPSEELAKPRRWFLEFDAAAWDAQIEADAAAGKFDALAEEALAEYRTGKAHEM